ncbi:hypothetical protein GGF46_002993 [Coemansia sp. RSA 552]|nr:hypothetical protein GGF46_002993 [Coemansia sp. RSA 552]
MTCRLWDTRANKTTCGIIGFRDEITAVGFVGQNNLAVACGSAIYIYDQRYTGAVARAQDMVATVGPIGGPSEIQGISTRGDFVAYVDEDGHVHVCDVTDPTDYTRLPGGHDALASCVSFHPTEPTIATGGFDRRVILWDVFGEKEVASAEAQVASDPSGTKFINPPFVYALDFDPDEEHTVVSGHADGRIMCSGDGDVLDWPECHNYSISALQFVRSNPSIVATAGLDCEVRLWDANTLTTPGKDTPHPLARHYLAAKPSAMVSSDTAPHIYIDQDTSIVSLALE